MCEALIKGAVFYDEIGVEKNGIIGGPTIKYDEKTTRCGNLCRLGGGGKGRCRRREWGRCL